MAKRIDILNRALINIGEKIINDLNDKSDRAVKIQLFYNEAIRETLRKYAWQFAERTIALTRRDDYKSKIGNLPYAYDYPENVVAVRTLFYEGQNLENLSELKKNRKKIHNFNGKVILLSNIDNAVANVTWDESNNEGIFDDIFVSALSFQLAALAAFSITGYKNKRNDMIIFFNNEIERAASEDHNENNVIVESTSSYEEARY